MAILIDNEITAADINSVITKITNEVTARAVSGGTNPSAVSQGGEIMGTTPTSMITRDTNINASHCYCQTDNGIKTHSGGKSLTLTAAAGNFDSGDEEVGTLTKAIETDIDNLVAQCDCNSYGCVCVTNFTVLCGCNTVCDCQAQCSCVVNCGCYIK